MITRMNDFTKKFTDINGDYISKDTVNVKDMLDSQPREVREYINNTLLPEVEIEMATKEDLNGVIAGQVNTTDPVTGKKYVIAIENGVLGVKEVG